MNKPIRLAVVVGTRPEAIKLAPLVLAAAAQPERFAVDLISTGQHKEMLASMLDWFGLSPAVSLDIMRPNQDLAHITNACLSGINDWLKRTQPDWVVVQGDTTSTFTGALAAFYNRIRVAHVEAGLRTHDIYSPFPEEANRVMTAHLTELHFPPTEGSRENLLREGIRPERILVTGNTGIDALLWTQAKLAIGAATQTEPAQAGFEVLVTAHRRENHGEPMKALCGAILGLLARYPTMRVNFPVHMSPKVREVVMPALGGHPRVRLTEPLDYPAFVRAMMDAHIILTDSGGVQEEAPSLGKPVLVLRDSTERPEAMQAGTARLVGTDPEVITQEFCRLMDDADAYGQMARAINPYGDGRAVPRILDAIERCSLA